MRSREGKLASITHLVSSVGSEIETSSCCPHVRLPLGGRQGHLVCALVNFIIHLVYFHIRICEDILTLLIQFTPKKWYFSKSSNSCVYSSCLLGHSETQSTVVFAGRQGKQCRPFVSKSTYLAEMFLKIPI